MNNVLKIGCFYSKVNGKQIFFTYVFISASK